MGAKAFDQRAGFSRVCAIFLARRLAERIFRRNYDLKFCFYLVSAPGLEPGTL